MESQCEAVSLPADPQQAPQMQIFQNAWSTDMSVNILDKDPLIQQANYNSEPKTMKSTESTILHTIWKLPVWQSDANILKLLF